MSPDDRRSQTINLNHSNFARFVATAKLAAAIIFCASAAACDSSSITGTDGPNKLSIASGGLPRSDELPPPENADQVVDLLLPLATNPQYNACRAEFVQLEGQQNAHFRISTSDDGNFHVEVHYNVADMKGVSVTPVPVDYMNVTTADFTWNIDGPPPMEQTHTVIIHLMRKGESSMIGPEPGDDFFFHEVFHVTINQYGVPTAVVDKTDTDCR